MARLTPKQLKDAMRQMGARGGANSRSGVTPAKARQLARRATQARWARWRAANGKPPKPGDKEFL